MKVAGITMIRFKLCIGRFDGKDGEKAAAIDGMGTCTSPHLTSLVSFKFSSSVVSIFSDTEEFVLCFL